MREIKFRVWIKSRKKMSQSVDFYNSRDVALYANTFNSRWVEDDDFELMQFTGLKDKTGKEIYEGDIILYRKLKLQVAFKGAHFIIEDSRTMMHEDLWKAPKILRKVIGNIYENPELLK